MYRYFGDKIHDTFTKEDFQLYRDVRQRIQQKIALAFGISSSSMYLTKPTFFSRINNSEAKTTHDEYWHPHIDKVTYGSFDYTSLLYLSEYTEDFGGGRFVFMDEGANRTVEPRPGRVSFFTSGSENLHHVEKVHWGTRYAITISFTCNPDHAIGDPAARRIDERKPCVRGEKKRFNFPHQFHCTDSSKRYLILTTSALRIIFLSFLEQEVCICKLSCLAQMEEEYLGDYLTLYSINVSGSCYSPDPEEEPSLNELHKSALKEIPSILASSWVGKMLIALSPGAFCLPAVGASK
ncbi:2-oxoglutarate and iron-dependent oxygenase domain-containing protein 3 [Varanus komodoensis]|nr:2-oxoglutarate and iron-dependent oxygenase domain-containing protein 3 [Varanus komodoensis]